MVALANYFGDMGVRKAYEELAKAAGVTIVAAVPVGKVRFTAIYRAADGTLKERLLTRADEQSISVTTVEQGARAVWGQPSDDP